MHGVEKKGIVSYRCRECNSYTMRAKFCPRCGSRDLEEEIAPEEGKIVACTKIFVAPSEFLSEVPYGVALIELSSGMRLMGRVEGEARIGADVKFCGVKESASGEYPVFEVKS